MSKEETPSETPNLDDMTFGEAFDYCQRNNIPEITWRGQYYAVDTVSDVADGFRRQADIDREQRAMSKNMADALKYGIGVARTRIDPKDFFLGVDMAKPEDPDFADLDLPIAGRMVTDKPVDLLRVERTGNGGWLVARGDSDVRVMDARMGAFTSTADMLRALADLLERDDERRKERADVE